ncbi:hypothetical protein ACP4OV_012308 [Aristida adscensionis]
MDCPDVDGTNGCRVPRRQAVQLSPTGGALLHEIWLITRSEDLCGCCNFPPQEVSRRIGYNDISVAEGGGRIGYSAVFLPHRCFSIQRMTKNVRFPISLCDLLMVSGFPPECTKLRCFTVCICPCLVCILLVLRKLKMQCFLELELELAGKDFHIPRSSKVISASHARHGGSNTPIRWERHISRRAARAGSSSPQRHEGFDDLADFQLSLKTAITRVNSRSDMATNRDALEVSAEMYRKDPNNVPDYVQRHLLSLSVWEELRFPLDNVNNCSDTRTQFTL